APPPRPCLPALPAATIRSRARLCLAQAVSAVVAGRVEAMEPLLIDAERAQAATGEEPHEPSVGRALSVLANVPASIAFLRADTSRLRGDAAGAIAHDQQALSHLGEGDWLLRSQGRGDLGCGGWLGGGRGGGYWGTPSGPCRGGSPGVGRVAKATWRCGWPTIWGKSNAPKGA